MFGKKWARYFYSKLAERILQHAMLTLCLLGIAVTLIYLLMASELREQRQNPSRLKTSAESAEVIQSINMALLRKASSSDAEKIDETVSAGLARLETIIPPVAWAQNPSYETLLGEYIDSVKRLANLTGPLASNDPALHKLLDNLSPRLLQEMQSASLEVQQQSEAMLDNTATHQHWMFAVSLGSLFVIGIWLLQPLLAQLQESATRARQEKLLADAVIDTAQVSIFVVDAQGHVVIMNRHAEKESGWLGNEVKGSAFAEYFAPADRRHEFQSLLQGMLSGEQEALMHLDMPLVVSTGEKKPMTWNLAAIDASAPGHSGLILLTGKELAEKSSSIRASSNDSNLLKFHAGLPDDPYEDAYDDEDDTIISSVASRVADNIIRIPDTLYRRNERRITRPAKEAVAFFTEDGYSGFSGHYDQDRICRILPRNNSFCNKLGWNRLLNQHNESLDDDLYALMPGKSEYRHFELRNTDDEATVTESVYSWLKDDCNVPSDMIDAVLTVLDEMLENSLYSAPRDSNGTTYYTKGEARELASYEQVSVDVSQGGDILGLMITDYWGTLTPSVFFKSLSQAMEEGIESMESGVGLYMIWRLSDYLQIRVHPHKCTQVTVLWDISNGFVDHNVDAGLQFLYHNDYEAPYQIRASI